jgi:hypothetical protein
LKPLLSSKNKLKTIEENLGKSICNLAAIALPVIILSHFTLPGPLSSKTAHFLSGTVTGLTASTASLIYYILSRDEEFSDDEISALYSQSGKGQPISRYDRSRYANNGRSDDSYTAKKGNSSVQYKKAYFKDGSMRMVPIRPAAEKTAPPRPSAPPTSSFSGLSMSPGEVTRDLTTEKDFVARQNDKKDLETVRPQQIASQEEAADAGDGDVGW